MEISTIKKRIYTKCGKVKRIETIVLYEFDGGSEVVVNMYFRNEFRYQNIAKVVVNGEPATWTHERITACEDFFVNVVSDHFSVDDNVVAIEYEPTVYTVEGEE